MTAQNNEEGTIVRVAIIESERGWGSKVDEVKHFSTMEEAEAFVIEFNAVNNEEVVPEWYMYAEIIETVFTGST